jgi:CBS-domain-containing membrane protein
LGMVRRRDLLRGLEPDFLANAFRHNKQPFSVALDANLTELSSETIVSGLKSQAERPVSDVMNPVKAVAQADDHILKVVYTMTETNMSFLPVLEDGKVVGVVRTVELFHEIARLVL